MVAVRLRGIAGCSWKVFVGTVITLGWNLRLLNYFFPWRMRCIFPGMILRGNLCKATATAILFLPGAFLVLNLPLTNQLILELCNTDG
ncbi:hypothetical protein GGR52DRAFT_546019 [Hypoxylon sp. FL1284]|nr:hypothetical protein GGR52DRAFT_546019 [Hypoxylon sp. FL1284]